MINLISGTASRNDTSVTLTSALHILPFVHLVNPAVNPPGTFYALINDNPNSPTAVACPSHTYGPGLKKQRACVPCPPGYTTEKVVGEAITPQTGQSLKSACGKFVSNSVTLGGHTANNELQGFQPGAAAQS